MRKWLGLTLLAAIAVVWIVLFRPLSLGGPASYVYVSGTSMEPRFHTGDLVILHRQHEYEVGDVVAFRTTSGTVIHRIVGGNAEDGFLVQGDNNPAVDWWRPRAEQVLGKQFMHLPNAGDRLVSLATPMSVGLAVSGLAMVSVFGTGDRRRRRKKGGGMSSRPESATSDSAERGGIEQWWPGSPLMLTVFGIAIVGGVLFLLLFVVAARRPADESRYVERIAYEQTGTFDYEVRTGPSLLYPGSRLEPVLQPDGTTAPPQPVFTQLARSMSITFSYELTSSAPADVITRLSADLVIRAGDGWTRREPLIDTRAFDGPRTADRFFIDFEEIGSLIEQVEEETGFDPSLYTLTVEPQVAIEGTIGGELVEERYLPVFEIEYTDTRITPPATLAHSEPSSIGDDVLGATELAVLGTARPVTEWRWIGAVGALIALAVATGIGAVVYLGIGQDEQSRIQSRYRAMLMPVESNGGRPGKESIHVRSMKHLAKLAARDGGIIFYEREPHGHRYFVRDGEDTYDYWLEAGAELGPEDDLLARLRGVSQ